MSHVADPEHHDDKEALSHLEQAMRMIRQMSTNHNCAQRAFTFLQQLMGFMKQNIDLSGYKSSAQTRCPSRNGAVMPMQDGADMNAMADYGVMPSNDLYAFWDYTQDLANNLGTQLQSYGAAGNTGMWNWSDYAQNVVAMPNMPMNTPMHMQGT